MGNQNVKSSPQRRRSSSFGSMNFEMVPEVAENGKENAEHYQEGETPRSKDDIDIRPSSPEDAPLRDIVIKMPRKKKQLEKLIMTQAIEIRGKDEIISEGKVYVMSMMDENDKCVRRIEERDQIIAAKDVAITALTNKLDSLKEIVEKKVKDLSEKEDLFEKARAENTKLKKHLDDQESIVKEMQGALDNMNKIKDTGYGSKKENGNFEERFELNTLKRENDRLATQLQDRENMIENGRKYLDRLKSDKEKLQQQLREKESENMEKDFVVERMAREGERDKIQIRQKEMEADGKGKALERTEEELKSIRDQLRQTENRLSDKEQNLDRTERAKNTLEREIAEERRTNSASLGRLREELGRIREEKRIAEERLRRVESQNETQQRTLQSLEADRNTAKQSADILRKDQPWMISKSEIIISESVLGTGAYGRVLEGEFRGMKVAVKEMHEVIQSAHNRRMFDREITFATLIRHPCILQFLGVADCRTNNPLLVLELMDMSLSGLLARERVLRKGHVTMLALDIAFGVNYLHCFKPNPILHRDLNPGNVMVWRQGDIWRAKLCDFGSAEFASARMSVNPGNPFYSAPEADSPRQTQKIDVYSYGVLLCELCTGQTPNPEERKRQIGLVWNADLKDHIGRCAQDKPEDRPSMAEIIDMLKTLGSIQF